jgi:glycosyltransferase 2 family protein
LSDSVESAAPSRTALIKLIARIVLGGSSAIFIAVAGYRLATRWESGKVTLNWPWVLGSGVPIAVGTVILAIGWKWIMERMVGHKVPLRPALTLHFESQMARYTPGKVGMPLVRMAGAASLGVPASVAGYSVLTESISMVAVGGVVGFALLMSTSGGAGGVLALLGRLGVLGFVAFVVVAIALVFVDRRRFPAIVVRLMKAEGVGTLVPRRGPVAHVLYWLTWAIHGYLAARAVGVSSAHAVYGAGLYVLAPIAGILALATPSGIGVREAVLSMGLAPIVGPAPAVATAIVSRAVSLVVDCLVWAFGRLVLR